MLTSLIDQEQLISCPLGVLLVVRQRALFVWQMPFELVMWLGFERNQRVTLIK